MKSFKEFINEDKNLPPEYYQEIHNVDIEDIEDMSLELKDDGFDVLISRCSYCFTAFKEDTTDSRLWREEVTVPGIVIRLRDQFFKWSDISEFVDRLVGYLGDNYEIVINSENTEYNKLSDFIDEQDEHYEMSIIIYRKLD
jgi:hypothetical protein